MTHEDEKELAALREQEAALAMKAKGANEIDLEAAILD